MNVWRFYKILLIESLDDWTMAYIQIIYYNVQKQRCSEPS